MPVRRWFHLMAALCLASLARAGPGRQPEAYRGGALVVTDPDRARGHLARGQVLPIRLSRLAPPAAGPPPLAGTEAPGSVRYGQLVFLEVSPARITFRVAFQEPGGLGTSRTVTLRPGEGVDLTGDGLQDLVFQAPLRPLLAGSSAIDYALLAFPCDAAHAAMFSLPAEACPGAKYPYAISGVTPGGRFIFQSETLPSAAGDLALLAPEVEPAPGDVLVEARTGTFGRIGQVHRTRRGLDIHYAAPETPFLFQEVFGAAYVSIKGLRPGREGVAWDPVLVDFDTTQNLLDGEAGRLDLEAAARVQVELSLTACVNYYGLSAELDAELDESLRLEVRCRAGRPWDLYFGPWTLAEPTLPIPAAGIPITLSLPVTAGLSADSHGTGTAIEGISARGHWGWSARVAASWGWRGVQVNAPAPEVRSSLDCAGLPSNRVRIDGKASIGPWLAVTPHIQIAHLLGGKCANTLSATGSILGGPDRAQVDAGYQLKAGCCLELPLLGEVWERSWPLYTWSRTVWSRPLDESF